MKHPVLGSTFALLLASLSLCAQAPAPAAPVPAKPVVKAPARPQPTPRARKPKAKLPQTDLNKASKEELQKLPGINAELADKIIKGRPYYSKSHITTRGIVPQGTYLALRNRVFVSLDPSQRPKMK